MKAEPSIDKAAIVDLVHREYELKVERLTFVPIGEVAHNYIADCVDHERYFLKLLGTSRQAQSSITRLDFNLRLVRFLYHKGLFRNLPCPIQTKTGELYTQVNDLYLILFNFIEGNTLEDQWPYTEKIRAAIAKSLATVHKNTPQIQLEIPYVEQFDIPFADELVTSINTLETISSAHRPGQQKLRARLLPHKEAILGFLDRLQELQNVTRAKPRDMVLCHTDPIAHNLLINAQGELFILDWEGTMLAPAEHDLFFFAGQHFPTFLQEYEQVCGPVSLDGDLFGFYFYRRNLEDLWAWLVRILHENTTSEQDERDLEGIVDDCMGFWPYFEDAIALIKAQLAKHATLTFSS